MSDKPAQRDTLRSPLELSNRMEWVLHYMRKGTDTVAHNHAAYLKAKEAYTKARILSMANYDKGSKADREDRAMLDNWDLYVAMNDAEAAWSYSRSKKSDLESELSGLQTESRLILGEMQLAGRVN